MLRKNPLTTKRPTFLPTYITKKIPLLPAPQKEDLGRRTRARLISGAIVGLPLLGIWSCSPDAGTFFEVVTILPLLPVFLIIALMDYAVFFVEFAWPLVIIGVTWYSVYIIVY